jgi:diguanylate cyclase (GGDEF)-like protein/PAS domain S-box-containing protein
LKVGWNVEQAELKQHSNSAGTSRVETALRAAHALLAEKTTLLLTMLGSISQGVFMVGVDGRVITFNPKVCELLDLPANYLHTQPTLSDITRYQLERGDFGDEADLVDSHARAYVMSIAKKPVPAHYLRTTKEGRVLEVKTQTIATGGMVRTFTDVTDYVQADQALQRSNQLLQATQAIAVVGGWDVDLRNDKVFWTAEVYRILELSPSVFTPTTANTLQFFAPEWQSTVLLAIMNAQAYGEPHTVEVEMITAKGRRIWVHTRSTLTLHQGEVVKRTSVIRDITAQKQAEAALRASEELFRQVTSQVPGMVYRVHIAVDGVFRYVFVSAGVYDLFGVTPEEVMADSQLLHTFRHPGDEDLYVRDLEGSISEGLPLSREFRILMRDGTQKWVQMTSSMVSQDATGTLRNGVVLDITARMQAEMALRQRDALWKLALESTGDGVWDWNIATGQESFSKRCLEMYGFSPGEMDDRITVLDDRTHPDDVSQMKHDRQSHFDGLTTAYTNEHRIRCKDGSWKWILSRGMVIARDEQGAPLRMTGTHTDISSRKAAEALIWHQANFDALTDLPNRRMLRERLEADLKHSREAGLQLAVLFIDLDHFKDVNDTLGHQQGDMLLMEAADRLRHCVGDTDTVARMGGDEFTVILPALVDVARVDEMAQKIIHALRTPFQLGTEQTFVSASIGITLFPGDATEIDSLFKHADQALYVAKGAGRNRFSYFTPTLQEEAQVRARLANDLRSALVYGQFWVAYQPIVELATGLVHKAEALIRWEHPTRGLVSPASFIPIAESSGLILEIGEWVFRQAAEQVARWRRSHHPQFQISVNKSPVQFHHNSGNTANPSHQAWVEHLASLGLPGQSIVVEITEGLLLDASAEVNAQLLALRDAGIGVSLDDFGTGYSSLSYLQKYDIDYLKIDQSFVRDLSASSKDLALCKAIIVMAHELGMRVIAEGVETTEQRDLLKAAGCDFAQGYLFSKPVPAAEFSAFLAR